MKVKKDATYDLSQLTGEPVFGLDASGVARPIQVNSSGQVLTNSGSGGSVNINDGAGNALSSTTGVPTLTDRGLITRVINFVRRNNKTETQQIATNGNLGYQVADEFGRTYVAPYCSPQEVQQLDSGAFSAAGGNSFGGAFGAGVRWYITGITFVHDNAVASRMSLSDGTSTIARATFAATQGSVHYTFNTPIRTAANGTFNCDLSNAGQCFIHIYGWTSTV